MPHPGEDWRSTLHKAACLLGRTDRVEEVIRHYEQKARDARSVSV
jgi:ABC-type Fe3+-hydroxamate transport system substrate-binding protein